MQASLIRVEYSCLLQECFRATWISENQHRRHSVLRGAAFTIKTWHLKQLLWLHQAGSLPAEMRCMYNLSLRWWDPLLDTAILLAFSWLLCLWAVLHMVTARAASHLCYRWVTLPPEKWKLLSFSFSSGKIKSYNAVSSIVSVLHSRAQHRLWPFPVTTESVHKKKAPKFII